MKKTNDFDWKDYEFITKYIYETLENHNGIKIEGWGNNCKIEGKSGIKHQIDILTVHYTNLHVIKTAIECKYLNKKVTKDTVMKLNSILQDCEIHKGIIVSKTGFTRDAIQLSQHYNIGLIELSHFDPKNCINILPQYELATIIPTVSIEIKRPIIKSITIFPTKSEIKLDNINQIYISISPTITHTLMSYVQSFQKELHKIDKLSQLIKREYEINGYFVEINRNQNPKKISKLIIEGELIEIKKSHKHEFVLVEKVFMIMNGYFGGIVPVFSVKLCHF